jgi:hypothetical protein
VSSVYGGDSGSDEAIKLEITGMLDGKSESGIELGIIVVADGLMTIVFETVNV